MRLLDIASCRVRSKYVSQIIRLASITYECPTDRAQLYSHASAGDVLSNVTLHVFCECARRIPLDKLPATKVNL
jgi:hypothetical protein